MTKLISQIVTTHASAIDDNFWLELEAADNSGRKTRPSWLLNQPAATLTAAAAVLSGGATFGGSISAANYVVLSQGTGDAATYGFTNANGPGIVCWGSAAAGVGKMQFNAGGAERMSIDTSGNITTFGQIIVGGAVSPANVANYYLYGNTNDVGINCDANDSFNYSRAANTFTWNIASSAILYLTSTFFYPGPDNTVGLGGGSNRWSVVYAATGTINTSDPAEKQDMRPFSKAELAAARDFQFRAFRWKDAVGKKGDRARVHYGFDAQQVLDTLKKHGIDPDTFAGFCRDPIIRRVKKTRRVERVKRESVEIEETREEVDGERIVRRVVRRTIERDVTRQLPLVDDKGAPIMEFGAIVTGTDGKPLLDRAGQPTRRMVAATRQVPVMETVEEEYEVEEDTGETRMSLRHDYLFALKIAALEAAK